MNLFTSLRYLTALHEHKHFGRAADACHITQPALSNAIRALEEEYGAAIVKRGRSFESFTPEGERIFLSAQRMLHEQEILLQDLKGSAAQPVGALTLGAVPSVLPVAARFAGYLQSRCPKLTLTVRSMSSQDIESGLENLSVDMGMGYTDRIKSRAARLSTIYQYNEHYFLLRRAVKPCKAGLRVSKTPMSWQAAAALPMCLLTPEMHNRSIVDATFKEIGVQVWPVIETNSILTLGLTVLVGDVCSILPGALVGVLRGYSELEAVPLVEPDVQTPIGFMLAVNERPSHAMKAALDLANSPEWLLHLRAHVGLLKSEKAGGWPASCQSDN
ncbi:LysR substrate-binding domain-containing protein [Rhodoferax sp.]|uniref:LysR family transcriptional regulator n=1 Tax=Rhodoferax sp. TaxID=50421 RepID=UPI00284F1EDE|nr:LysR substrate-binding domain-containing protein [Rhodoferax sp.]MDR3370658.1 LysR substrate-binding domain-containing protein [Rhodoferax sp.]